MKTWLSRSYLACVFFLLYLPIFILVVFSFNDARYSLRWHGFSIQWYTELFQDTALWTAFWHSVLLGICTCIGALFLSLTACIYLLLNRRENKSLLNMLILLIIIPDIVMGVALLIFFNIAQFPLGFFSLLISHITFCVPFAVITINSHAQTLDKNIYFSALDLGATRMKAFFKILLPLLAPGIISALLLCFTLSFDDVIISYFVSGPDFTILPLTIFSLVRTGVTPELNALCSITFILSVILVTFAHILGKKSP